MTSPHNQTMSLPVGLIGVGLLGSALAGRLIDRGCRVIGFDIDPGRRRWLAERGGTAAATAAEVFGQCRTTLLSLPDSDAAARVLDENRAAISAGSLVVDTTTGAPAAAETAARQLESAGSGYLDATVVGSSQQAQSGDVLMLVGGSQDVFQSCQPLLDGLARRVFYVGPSGSGARMKLVVNLVLGLHRAVLAEGLSLARACGLDPVQALEVLQAGAARSEVMASKGDKMIREDFAPQARLDQHRKDVRLIRQLAEEYQARVPLTEVHEQLLASASQQGFGQADNCAVIKAYG